MFHVRTLVHIKIHVHTVSLGIVTTQRGPSVFSTVAEILLSPLQTNVSGSCNLLPCTEAWALYFLKALTKEKAKVVNNKIC